MRAGFVATLALPLSVAAASPVPSASAAPNPPAPGRAEARDSLIAVTATARLFRVILVSPSGHPARATLRLPRDSTASGLGAVVVVGGFGGGWRSAALLDPGRDVALLSVDYPYVGRRARIPAGDILLRGPALWRATHEMSALLAGAGEYLARREDVDSTRLALVGASLGAPFALRAAAESQRFRAVAILYGQADLSDWIQRNLRGVPRWIRPLIGGLAAILYADYEPARLVPRVSPRPLLLVNGRGDERVSEEKARRLYEAAREPREQVWIEGAHVGLERERILGRLFEVTARWYRTRAFPGGDGDPGRPATPRARGGAPPRSRGR